MEGDGFGLIRGTVVASAWSDWGRPQKKVTVSDLKAEILTEDPQGMEHECCLLECDVL